MISVPPLAELLSPDSVAWGSRALTAAIGLFVAGLAYRGFRRNDAPQMRSLAVGVGLLTTGVFLTVTVADQLGARVGVVLVVRGIVTVVGLCAVLFALLSE